MHLMDHLEVHPKGWLPSVQPAKVQRVQVQVAHSSQVCWQQQLLLMVPWSHQLLKELFYYLLKLLHLCQHQALPSCQQQHPRLPLVPQ